MIGALFLKDARLRYTLAKSTNKEDFLTFLQKKIHPFIKYPRSTVLVMDNHRAHHSKVVVKWLQEKQYVMAFLPPYSSELNPIEHIWSVMKNEWGKVLFSQEFEARMLRNSRPIKEIRNEFDEASDGELLLNTR